MLFSFKKYFIRVAKLFILMFYSISEIFCKIFLLWTYLLYVICCASRPYILVEKLDFKEIIILFSNYLSFLL